jgi:hypothetical protein
MTAPEQIRHWCLEIEGVEEMPHFEKTSFRIKKKIFATLGPDGRVCLKLNPDEQNLFGLFDPTAVYPVPNRWGKMGWTFAEPERIPEETMKDLILSAYREVSKKPSSKK